MTFERDNRENRDVFLEARQNTWGNTYTSQGVQTCSQKSRVPTSPRSGLAFAEAICSILDIHDAQ